jgi:hypothetical protein
VAGLDRRNEAGEAGDACSDKTAGGFWLAKKLTKSDSSDQLVI